ncbi:hypothetical protein RDWZM_009009 [Blomia tropicalis]|uniref:Protein YIPF n=1 Tax=Blomia tropicalis TaxID=40697 RepID=A0A9Q0M2U6_BLOTA|nr:Yip1 member 6 [Blomia tropicalis]KAJ6217852.1 hypothetical protein RDWZM_009009 [Blomia tropicalis]
MNIPESTVNDPNRMMGSHIGSWDTLDEPIWDTISRDISSIGLKLRHILIPLSEKDVYHNVCKNWDLWGPFIFFTYIAFSLNNCGEECVGYHQSNFSSIFVILWLGNMAVCLNYKLLLNSSTEIAAENVTDDSMTTSNKPGSNYPMSIFQLLCLFGYTLAIPSIGILLLQLSTIFISGDHIYARIIVTLFFGFLYPVGSSLNMLSNYISNGKYFLIVYPILMFFTILSLYLYTFA